MNFYAQTLQKFALGPQKFRPLTKECQLEALLRSSVLKQLSTSKEIKKF